MTLIPGRVQTKYLEYTGKNTDKQWPGDGSPSSSFLRCPQSCWWLFWHFRWCSQSPHFSSGHLLQLAATITMPFTTQEMHLRFDNIWITDHYLQILHWNCTHSLCGTKAMTKQATACVGGTRLHQTTIFKFFVEIAPTPSLGQSNDQTGECWCRWYQTAPERRVRTLTDRVKLFDTNLAHSWIPPQNILANFHNKHA